MNISTLLERCIRVGKIPFTALQILWGYDQPVVAIAGLSREYSRIVATLVRVL